MDYWLNPANESFHQKRGPFSDAQKQLLVSQPEKILAQIRIPEKDRMHTTAILEVHGRAIGHLVLNDIRDEAKRRIHFHLWRKTGINHGLNHAAKMWDEVICLAKDYFSLKYGLAEIIGDVSTKNKIANYVLAKLGYAPTETVMESYLGYEAAYNRFVFKAPTKHPAR